MVRVSRWMLALGLGLGCAAVSAQQIFDQADWKELDAPPAPAFDVRRVVAVDMPAYSALQVGVDPSTIQIGADGVVRYVVVASSRAGSAVNAFYEGVRCSTQEVKTYARSSGDGWQNVQSPEWQRLGDRSSRYSAGLATQALCRGNAPRRSVSEMLGMLRNPVREVQ